jgi:hypothetical protein
MDTFLAAHFTKSIDLPTVKKQWNVFLDTYTDLSEQAATSSTLWEIRKTALGGLFDLLLPQTNVHPSLYIHLKEAALTHYATVKGTKNLTLQTILDQVTAKHAKAPSKDEGRKSRRAPMPNPKYPTHPKKPRMTRKKQNANTVNNSNL